MAANATYFYEKGLLFSILIIWQEDVVAKAALELFCINNFEINLSLLASAINWSNN